MAGKKGWSGGARPGAGRKRGGHNRATLALREELDRHRDPAVEDMLPSAFLKRVMLDESAPLAARIMCARGVIPYLEQPELTPPGEIPLLRYWTKDSGTASSGG